MEGLLRVISKTQPLEDRALKEAARLLECRQKKTSLKRADLLKLLLTPLRSGSLAQTVYFFEKEESPEVVMYFPGIRSFGVPHGTPYLLLVA